MCGGCTRGERCPATGSTMEGLMRGIRWPWGFPSRSFSGSSETGPVRYVFRRFERALQLVTHAFLIPAIPNLPEKSTHTHHTFKHHV